MYEPWKYDRWKYEHWKAKATADGMFGLIGMAFWGTIIYFGVIKPIGWLGEKFTHLYQWVVGYDYMGLVPDAVWNFFALPSQQYFLYAAIVMVVAFFLAIIVSRCGNDKEPLLRSLFLIGFLLAVWSVIGVLKGVLYAIAEYGFFSALGLGCKIVWQASIPFFYKTSPDLGLWNTFMSVLMKFAVFYMWICLASFAITRLFGFLGIIRWFRARQFDTLSQVIVASFTLFFLVWLPFALGGIIYLWVT